MTKKPGHWCGREVVGLYRDEGVGREGADEGVNRRRACIEQTKKKHGEGTAGMPLSAVKQRRSWLGGKRDEGGGGEGGDLYSCPKRKTNMPSRSGREEGANQVSFVVASTFSSSNWLGSQNIVRAGRHRHCLSLEVRQHVRSVHKNTGLFTLYWREVCQ